MSRARGRPRHYPNGTEIMSLRVPVGMSTLIRGAIARLRLQPGCRDLPAATILLEGLKRQIRGLENQDPRARESLDKIERREAELMRAEPVAAELPRGGAGAESPAG